MSLTRAKFSFRPSDEMELVSRSVCVDAPPKSPHRLVCFIPDTVRSPSVSKDGPCACVLSLSLPSWLPTDGPVMGVHHGFWSVLCSQSPCLCCSCSCCLLELRVFACRCAVPPVFTHFFFPFRLSRFLPPSVVSPSSHHPSIHFHRLHATPVSRLSFFPFPLTHSIAVS